MRNMKKWNLSQKQFLADFFNNLSIVILTLGILQPLFDRKLSSNIFLIQFTISITVSTLILISSFKLLKK